MESKVLTWDDLANLYYKRTGKQARTKPMELVYNWGLSQKDIIENEDTSLSLVKRNVKV